MSREREFRGKDKNGTWHYGSLYSDRSQTYINSGTVYKHESGDGELCLKHPHEVLPETVGQYTGLKDKNGKEIYFNSDIVGVTVIDDYDGSESNFSGIMYICLKTYKIVIKGHENFNLIFADSLEIIGNIHDNKE